jgi:hypothetical protein
VPLDHPRHRLKQGFHVLRRGDELVIVVNQDREIHEAALPEKDQYEILVPTGREHDAPNSSSKRSPRQFPGRVGAKRTMVITSCFLRPANGADEWAGVAKAHSAESAILAFLFSRGYGVFFAFHPTHR